MNLDEELEAAKRILLDLNLEKEALLKSNNLAKFVPNPKGQTEFFDRCDTYLRAVFAGNRFGKSFIGCVEDVSWLLGERIFFPKDHPLRYKGIPQHGVKGYLVVANWDKSREIFTKEGDPATDDSVGKLFKFLPKDCWKITGRNQGYVAEITVTSRPHGIERVSYIKIITTNAWKKDFLTAESGDIDFIHIDEPTEEELWNGLARGLVDRGGKAWWLMTAKSQPWMYYHMEDMVNKNSKNYWMYLGSQRENITLDEENIERFAEGLNDKAKATAIDGVPSFKSNLVIYTFDERQHILDKPPKGWKDRLTPPEDWNIAVAIDTHPQTPHAVLMVAISPKGDVVAFNERFEKGPIKGPNSISEWLFAQPCFSRCSYLLLEPAAWNSDQITKRAFVEDFYEAGLSPVKGTKFRSEAIVKMCDRFGAISPSTTILTSCPVFIKEIKRWAFDKDDKPRDKDDHMLENFGRLLFYNDFTYQKQLSNQVLTPSSDYHDIGFSQYKDNLNLNYL